MVKGVQQALNEGKIHLLELFPNHCFLTKNARPENVRNDSYTSIKLLGERSINQQKFAKMEVKVV